MSDVASVSSGSGPVAPYATQTQAILRVLEQTMDMQMEIMTQLLESMGVGQNIDLQA